MLFISLKKEKNINIAHLLYDFPNNPWVGGGGSYRNIEIYKRFPSNYKITLICGNYKGKKINKIRNIQFVYLGLPINYFVSRFTYMILGTLYFKKNYKKFDLIINDYCCYFPINTYQVKNSIIMIQNFFGMNLLKKFLFIGIIPYFLEKYKIKKFPYFIFSSNFVKQKFTKYLNLKKIYHTAIPYGIEEQLFKPFKRKKKDYILYLGRIEFYQKGLDLLLEAMKISFLKNVQLIVAGNGKDEKKLLKAIKDNPNIKYIGRVDGFAKYNILRGARFLVMPSRYESFGIVAVEGSAVSKPVVGLANTGLEETIINNKTGYLLKSNDVSLLAKTIYKLWHNKKLQLKLGKNAKIFAKNFQWSVVAKEQLTFYNKILRELNILPMHTDDVVKTNIKYTNTWWASNILGIKNILYTERIHYYYFFKFLKKNRKKINFNKKKLIDIGFGTGWAIKHLSKKYHLKTTGLDISKTTINNYNKKIKKALKINSHAKLIDPFKNKLPFKNQEIDYVICSHILEHVPDDDFLLKEIMRVLKKGGIVYFNIPINEEKLKIPNHLRKYTTMDFYKKLKKHNFKIINTITSDNFTLAINYFGLHKNLCNNILKKGLILVLSLLPIKFLELLKFKKSQYICFSKK